MILRMPFTDSVLEVQITPSQADALESGRAIAWRSPEVPDITVDQDGTITEHEDARPRIP
jgi:hypothetical protein